MSQHLSNARLAVVLAVMLALFVSGMVTGAAGDFLVLGSLTNSSGASGTKVSSNVNGNAFAIAQTGAGASANGIRGDASSGTGGVFTSSTNNALFATAASGNRYAMVAVSNGGAGTGGGILAIGNANPGLTVDVDSNSVPPLEVNSTGQVANLNSDLLDGWHANGLSRFAYAAHDAAAWTAPLVDGDAASTGRLTVTIDTPGWGYLQIIGNAHLYNETNNGADAIGCWLEVDNNVVPGSEITQDTYYGTSGVPNLDQQSCSPSGGYRVCNAATYTIDLEFDDIGVDGNVEDASLMVEYIPFNGAGNTPFLSCLIILSPTHTGTAEILK